MLMMVIKAIQLTESSASSGSIVLDMPSLAALGESRAIHPLNAPKTAPEETSPRNQGT